MKKKYSPTSKENVQSDKAFQRSLGILSHEFPQHVIDACYDDVLARHLRIKSGETTFEEEDALLMEQWKKLHNH